MSLNIIWVAHEIKMLQLGNLNLVIFCHSLWWVHKKIQYWNKQCFLGWNRTFRRYEMQPVAFHFSCQLKTSSYRLILIPKKTRYPNTLNILHQMNTLCSFILSAKGPKLPNLLFDWIRLLDGQIETLIDFAKSTLFSSGLWKRTPPEKRWR